MLILRKWRFREDTLLMSGVNFVLKLWAFIIIYVNFSFQHPRSFDVVFILFTFLKEEIYSFYKVVDVCQYFDQECLKYLHGLS